MTAAATRPPHVGLPEVRPHRTREGRLDFVTVQREADGVVRVLGWFDTRTAAEGSLHPAHRGAVAALDLAVALAGVATRALRPRLIRPRLIH